MTYYEDIFYNFIIRVGLRFIFQVFQKGLQLFFEEA